MTHTDITLTTNPNAVVVAVSGEVDMAVEDLARDQLLAAVKTADVEGVGVVVDLSATSFLDSTGIRLLVQAHRAAVAAGVGLTVVGATGLVLRVLEVTGVLGLLTEDSRDPDPA